MTAPLGTRQAVLLVAGREFRTRARTRASIIGTAVVLVLLVVVLVLVKLFGTGDDPVRLALVGEAEQLSVGIEALEGSASQRFEVSTVQSASDARQQVRDGDVDVALELDPSGTAVAVVDAELDETVETLLGAAVRQQAVNQALVDEGVDPGVIAEAAGRATVEVEALDPPDPDAGQRAAIAYVVILVLYLQLFIFGLNVATGVVEEKVSRVVEILLATIRPLQLLMGKVLGIGAVGLVQLALFAAVGFGVAIALDLITITGTAVATAFSGLLWFTLGYLLFALLYAAAAATVSRQEDVNAVTTPINFVVIGMFLLAQQAVFDPTGGLAAVLSWIPPFSAILMPLLVATGEASGLQVVITAALMIVAIALAWVFAARVYEQAILRTGARVRLREVLRSPSSIG